MIFEFHLISIHKQHFPYAPKIYIHVYVLSWFWDIYFSPFSRKTLSTNDEAKFTKNITQTTTIHTQGKWMAKIDSQLFWKTIMNHFGANEMTTKRTKMSFVIRIIFIHLQNKKIQLLEKQFFPFYLRRKSCETWILQTGC